MIYADYAFYKEDYKGKLVPEEEFDMWAGLASAHLDIFTFGNIPASYPREVKSACCAVIEELYKQEQIALETLDGVISSEKSGSYSVSYADMAKTNQEKERQVYSAASLYLANTGLLYRGGDSACKW